MTVEELLFWEKWPLLAPLYERFADRLLQTWPDVAVKVQKTQISFYNRHLFAMASPPARRRKGWPSEFVMVSFGLPYRLDAPEIAMSVEAYPNRWTHHVILTRPEDIGDRLFGWLGEAYAFAAAKR